MLYNSLEKNSNINPIIFKKNYKKNYEINFNKLFVKYYTTTYSIFKTIKNTQFKTILKNLIIFQIITKINQTLLYLLKSFKTLKIIFQATHGMLSKFFNQKKKSYKRNPRLINVSIALFYKYWEINLKQHFKLIIHYKYGSQTLLYALKYIENFFFKVSNHKITHVIYTPKYSLNRLHIKKKRRIKKRLKKKLIKMTRKYVLHK